MLSTSTENVNVKSVSVDIVNNVNFNLNNVNVDNVNRVIQEPP